MKKYILGQQRINILTLDILSPVISLISLYVGDTLHLENLKLLAVFILATTNLMSLFIYLKKPYWIGSGFKIYRSEFSSFIHLFISILRLVFSLILYLVLVFRLMF